MSKTSISIQGVIITTALTHQESPGSKGGQMKSNVVGADNQLLQVPYVTVNSVRGLLRRAAADVILEKLEAQARETGKTISRDVYLSIVRGAYARTAISPQGPTFAQAKAAADHVFAGLFGGGSLMLESRFRFERDLFPVLDLTMNTIPTQLGEYALSIEPWRLLQSTLMAPRDDFEKIPTRAVVTDLEDAYMEHMQTKIHQQSDSKEAKESKDKDGQTTDGKTKDDLNGFSTIECIIPGVPLCFCLDVPNVTTAQAGMVIKAIQRWVNRNALGGGSQRGRGAFIPKLKLFENGSLITNDLFFDQAPNTKVANDPRITEFLSALELELESAVNTELLETIYPTETKSKAGVIKVSKAKGKDKEKNSALAGA